MRRTLLLHPFNLFFLCLFFNVYSVVLVSATQQHMHAKSLQSCLTLCNPMDCSPPGFSVHGVLQARIPEWVAMPFSRGSSEPRDRTHISYVSCTGKWVLYHQRHLESPDS